MPFRLDVCGLLLELSLTLSCPVLTPVAFGVNVTLIVQVDGTAKTRDVEIAMQFSVTVSLLVKGAIGDFSECSDRKSVV